MPNFKRGADSEQGFALDGSAKNYTAATLPDPATLGAGKTVVVDGIQIDSNGKYWSRQSKPAKYHLFTGRNFFPDTMAATGVLTRAYKIYKPILTNRKISKIKLVYANWQLKQNGVETNNTSTPTVLVSVHKESDTIVTPVFFNGAKSRVFAAGETVVSDEIPIALDPSTDAGFYILQHVTVGATTDALCTSSDMTTAESTNQKTFRIQNATSAFVDVVSGYSGGGNPPEYGAYEFGPVAVLGIAEDGSVIPCVGIIGSSSAQGSGDTNNQALNADFARGYLARALTRSRIPYINAAISGETGANFLGAGGAKRRYVLSMCNFTHAVSTYGSNDIGGGLITTDAQVQTLNINLYKLMKGWGAIPHLCTYTPATSSTDSWATVANQTVGSALRVNANAWLLANTATYNVIDLEKWSDSGRAVGLPATGKWRIDLGAPTTDGLHGTPMMHNAIATGLVADNAFFRVRY